MYQKDSTYYFILSLSIALSPWTQSTQKLKGNRTMSILFITGTSGSGKTTLVHHLRAQLPSTLFEVYDFDENGVPQDADAVWRQETDYWLQKAAENSSTQKNRPSCAGLPFHQKLYSLRKDRIYPSTLGFLKFLMM